MVNDLGSIRFDLRAAEYGIHGNVVSVVDWISAAASVCVLEQHERTSHTKYKASEVRAKWRDKRCRSENVIL